MTRRHRMSLGGFGVVLLLAAICVTAQTPERDPRVETAGIVSDSSGKGSIRGRVVAARGQFIAQSLKVTLLTLQGPQTTIFTDSQGQFEFPGLNPGNYEVEVETNGIEYHVVSQNVRVFRGAPSIVTIELPEAVGTKVRAGNPSISVGEIGADVPKAARKEFESGNKSVDENKTEEAVAHFRKAISICPNFVMARNNLGAQLLAQGKLDEAAEELRQAIQIDEKAFNPKLNLGIVLAQKQEFAEAAEVLDRALTLNSESPSAQLYAGLAQMGLGNLDEAEKHLKAAYTLGGNSYSLALFHLGQLYMNKGERELALKAFQDYLHDSPSARNADQVRKLMAMLR